MTDKEYKLFDSVAAGEVQSVERLVRKRLFLKGVNINVRNEFGSTPLHVAIINDQPAKIDLYFAMPSLPLSLVLLLAVGTGIVLGAIASSFYFMRIKKENADLRRQTRQVEQEVKNLRTLPINGR